MNIYPYQVDTLITIKKGDTVRCLYDSLYLGDTAIPLSGSSVFFVMYDNNTDTVTSASATITVPSSGSVSYQLQSSAISASGDLLCEWRIVDSQSKVITLPTDGYIKVSILDTLG